jgi:hypothetical protein
MTTKQYQPGFLIRLDNLATLDVHLLRDLTPKPLKQYTIPGYVTIAGLSRARTTGQSNFLTRVRAHLIAFRLAGHGREWGERVLARIWSMVDEIWPPADLCPADAEQIEAFADSDEDRVYCLWKNGRTSAAEYASALEAQLSGTRTLLVSIRQRIAARVDR